MKNSEKIYVGLLLLVFVILGVIEYNTPLPIDWADSFSKIDKIPYGDYAVYDMLPDIFPDKHITSSELPLYKSLDDSAVNTNLIIINKSFDPDTLETNSLFSYVSRGNTAFIASEYFYGPFADTLKIRTEQDLSSLSPLDSNSLNFTDDDLWMNGADYAYKKGSVDSYFEEQDKDVKLKDRYTILSKNSRDSAVMISLKYGAGTFILSSTPMAFTNYYALKYPQNDYIFKAFSYLPVADTRWDEYYKMVDHKASTPLRYILNNSSLKRAYFIMLFGLFIYILFEGKRKQRMIPIITPPQNTSLEFTETIGRLYFQKGTNKGIAEKRIRYMFDYIRTKFKVNATDPQGEFYNTLSAKTIISISELKELFTFILRVHHQEEVDSPTLLQLNTMIEDFYKKTT